MLKEITLEQVFKVDVDWDVFYRLKADARENPKSKELYENVLKKLYNLNVFGRAGGYSVDFPRCDGGGSANPVLDDVQLYFTKEKDAIKVQERFPNSILEESLPF